MVVPKKDIKDILQILLDNIYIMDMYSGVSGLCSLSVYLNKQYIITKSDHNRFMHYLFKEGNQYGITTGERITMQGGSPNDWMWAPNRKYPRISWLEEQLFND